jgi:hypothetical protein
MKYRATPAISMGYSIPTSRWYFVHNPLAKTLHRSRDVEFREGKLYTAPNAADEAILKEALLQRCHQGTETRRKATNRMANGGVIGQLVTSRASKAKEEVTRTG